MSAEKEMVIKDIVGAIRRLVRAVYLDSSKISKQYGITAPQSGVLRNLYKCGPLSSARLSRKLHVTPSNITGIIDRLERKGMVKRIREQRDRRVVLITLTESGEALSRTLPDPIEKKLISGLAYLEPDAIQQLGRAMNEILKLIDAKGVEASPLGLAQGAGPVANEEEQR